MPNSKTDKGDIVVEITCSCRQLKVSFAKLVKLAEKICRRFSVSEIDISVAIVDDEAIEKVNKEFLGRAGITDVISFDLSDGPQRKASEVVINGEMAVRQGGQRGHSAEAEVALYMTHGLLHQLGYDDDSRASAQKMHDMEDKILREAGFGIVYGKSTK